MERREPALDDVFFSEIFVEHFSLLVLLVLSGLGIILYEVYGLVMFVVMLS